MPAVVNIRALAGMFLGKKVAWMKSYVIKPQQR